MMDEELHRVLLFLMDVLNKMPGWTHQGMLQRELLTAPLECTLHRVLGTSPPETFAEFLKCFPTIFCINSNHLVHLNTKNGSSLSDTSGMASAGGGLLKLHSHHHDHNGGGILPVGTRSSSSKLPLTDIGEWSGSPVSTHALSEGVGKQIGFVGRELGVQSAAGSLCGIPASYPGSSTTAVAGATTCGGLGCQPRPGSGSGGWDPGAHSLPDLHHSFLGSDMGRGNSVGHLENGWERSSRAIAIPNSSSARQPSRFSGVVSAEAGAGDSARLLNHHRYTWGESASHSLTDSLKNFSISSDVNYTGSSMGSVSSSVQQIHQPQHDRWMSYGGSVVSSDGLDGYGSSDDRRFSRPITSVWEEAIRPQTPSSQQQRLPLPQPLQQHPQLQQQPPPRQQLQQGFLGSTAGDVGAVPINHSSFKWDDPEPVVAVPEPSDPLGFGSLSLGSKQQYYEWKSLSPVMVEMQSSFQSPEPSKQANENTALHLVPATDLVEKAAAERSCSALVEEPVLAKILPTSPDLSTEISVVVEEEDGEVDDDDDDDEKTELAAQPKSPTGPTILLVNSSPGCKNTESSAASNKQGTTLSYAEALRSNTQRRKPGADAACAAMPAAGSTNCNSSHTVPPFATPPANIKLSLSGGVSSERTPKSRRSLDGRCGKVELLNPGDGMLRLGNGRVHFDRSIFYDNGRSTSDLRAVLKSNDTVYFDALVDSSGNYEWKATLAWVGKKPRLSASSPTNPNATLSGRSYRGSSENHTGISSSNNNNNGNGVSSRILGSNSANNKMPGNKELPLPADATVEGTGEVVILFAHFGFIRRGKKFKENVHFNRNVFYANGNRVKELTDVLKEGGSVNYMAVPSDKKSCKWKAVLVWTGTRPKV